MPDRVDRSGELTIVGIGMIGGSFALASRAGFERILGLDPDAEHAAFAEAQGIIDAAVDRVPPATDAILLSCPSDRIASWIIDLADHPATVFDTGSVKGAILSEVQASLGRIPDNFVATHPIAGLERSGPQAANGSLFVDRSVIVTPVESTDERRRADVARWWQATGARVEVMEPGEHDRVYARTSHLPHLLAFAYLLGIDEQDLLHCGGGFRDFSRIGASDPDMWSGIFARNQLPLLEALGAFEANLAEFRTALESGDIDTCRALISKARACREALE
jgi:prephenate dehydrogenase